jgi:hypothetical protein
MNIFFSLILVFLGLFAWQEFKIEKNAKTTINYNNVERADGSKTLNVDVGGQQYAVEYPFDLGKKFPSSYSKNFTLYWYDGYLIDRDDFINKEDYLTRRFGSIMFVTFRLSIDDDYNQPGVNDYFYKDYELIDSEYPWFKKYESKSKFAYGDIVNKNMVFCKKIYEEGSARPACSTTVYVGSFAWVQVRFSPVLLKDWAQFKNELDRVFNAISYVEEYKKVK